jgi:hypothetical protein
LTKKLTPATAAAILDRYFPSLGPCFCCGQADGRHRQIAIIREWIAAGNRVSVVADDQGVSEAAVLACLGLDVPDLRHGDPVAIRHNGWRDRPLPKPKQGDPLLQGTFLRYEARSSEAWARVRVPGAGLKLVLLEELSMPF